MVSERGGVQPSSGRLNMPEVSDEMIPSNEGESDQLFNVQSSFNAQKLLAERASQPQNFTFRGVAVGLAIGILICFSNVYFGLQTGWVSGMAMPSALIGYGFFRMLSSHLQLPFTPVENVLIQTVAGSVGVMPLGAGLVGVMPALEFLLTSDENGPLKLDFKKLCLWAVGTCFFGVVIGVPLRRQVIIREKLKFPSGSATALMIAVLHGEKQEASLVQQTNPATEADDSVQNQPESRSSLEQTPPQPASQAEMLDMLPPAGNAGDWRARLRLLLIAFVGSCVYTLFSYFVPQVRTIPILGTSIATNWLWTLNPSPAYVGQGIIMGPATCTHMLLGAIVGWGILSPLAKSKGWAPGPVSDWETGSKGWIVWISLAIMFADAIVSLGWLVLRPAINYARFYLPRLLDHRWSAIRKLRSSQGGYSALSSHGGPPPPTPADINQEGDEEADAPPEHQISTKVFLIGLIISIGIYFGSIHLAFDNLLPLKASILALIMSCLLSIMSIRALGETDLNPVSGISKLTQLFFALIIPRTSPNAVIINLIAGAVTESGALQAGDLLQDLKAGHLLGAAPSAQFYGQLIGAAVGAVVSVGIYKLYTSVYTIPSGMFQVPTAFVWIFTARLVTGKGLPPEAGRWAIYAGVVFIILTALRTWKRDTKYHPWIPGGIAFAIGMYNEPNFTLARFTGGMVSAYWTKYRGRSETNVVVLASGLILGEGISSIVNLLLASSKVPHL